MIIKTDVIAPGTAHAQIAWEFESELGRYASSYYVSLAGPHVKMQVLRTAVEFRRFMNGDCRGEASDER